MIKLMSMSEVRDIIAMIAMQTILTNPHIRDDTKASTIAQQAYAMADAMLAARDQT